MNWDAILTAAQGMVREAEVVCHTAARRATAARSARDDAAEKAACDRGPGWAQRTVMEAIRERRSGTSLYAKAARAEEAAQAALEAAQAAHRAVSEAYHAAQDAARLEAMAVPKQD